MPNVVDRGVAAGSDSHNLHSTPSSVTAPFWRGAVLSTCYSRPEQPIKGARTLKYQTQSVFSSPPAGSGTHSKESHSERFSFFVLR
eukprot:scaffold105599_cov89-Phaeocystis_antarctica.AAC.1